MKLTHITLDSKNTMQKLNKNFNFVIQQFRKFDNMDNNKVPDLSNKHSQGL